MLTHQNWITGALLLGAAAFIAGCSERSSAPETRSSDATAASGVSPDSRSTGPKPITPTAAPGSDEHGHKAGSHGGIIVSLGRDSYHAEAVFEKGGVLRLYMLGNDESRVIDIEKQTLKGYVKADGDAESQQFMLQADPQVGDAAERTSQFIGTLPDGLQGAALDVTIPNLVISGERFRLGFTSRPEPHDEGIPDKVVDEEERQLYLTPGGKYTKADIAANGNVTASVKFKGLKSAHDMSPKPGDRICPVTKTKANPQFTWIVDGKPYEFCCPPCVDEFVKMAKTAPDEIQQPADYVKPQ